MKRFALFTLALLALVVLTPEVRALGPPSEQLVSLDDYQCLNVLHNVEFGVNRVHEVSGAFAIETSNERLRGVSGEVFAVWRGTKRRSQVAASTYFVNGYRLALQYRM